MRPGATAKFQSAPGTEAGGNVAAVPRFVKSHQFQSAPGTEAGGNPAHRVQTCIIQRFRIAPGTEAGGNVGDSAGRIRPSEFQSAPGTEAGGNGVGVDSRPVSIGFNPPPALRPGETHRCSFLVVDASCFNPPPALRPGETAALQQVFDRIDVSIRPRH